MERQELRKNFKTDNLPEGRSDVSVEVEDPTDIYTTAAIKRLHAEAFKDPHEADLVNTLHRAKTVTMSLIAKAGSTIVGNICYTQCLADVQPDNIVGCCLKRLGVRQSHQRQGIGKRLIKESLERIRDEGKYDFILCLGHLDYYTRFGWQAASPWGLKTKYGVEDSFMILELSEGTLKKLSGHMHCWPHIKKKKKQLAPQL